MEHVYEFKTKKITWINATKASLPQVNYLAKKYNINPEDATDILPPIQRSKLVVRQDYLFMILLFPVYHRESKKISAEEINFCVSRNHLITFHNNKIPAINNLFEKCNRKSDQPPCSGDIASILYAILDSLMNYCFPMMRHLNLDVEMIEEKIFKKYEQKQTVDRILRIKTNIFDFQKIMQSHEYVLNKLMATAPQFFSAKKLESNFIHLAEYARETNLSLQSLKDNINALHEANSTLVDYRVNEILKTLTIFSVIVFPLTLIASIFGMNTKSMPLVGSVFDFWKILAIMAGGAVAMLGVFKWKKWI